LVVVNPITATTVTRETVTTYKAEVVKGAIKNGHNTKTQHR